MKKIYQKPEQRIVKVKVMTMLASSPNALLDPSKSVDAGSIESRRRYDYFDDNDNIDF